MLFKEKDKVIHCRLDSITYDKLLVLSSNIDLTVSELVRKSIMQFVSNLESSNSLLLNPNYN